MVYVSETVYDTPDTSPTSPYVVAVAAEVEAAVNDADAVDGTAEDEAPLVAPEETAPEEAADDAAPELMAEEDAALDAATEEATEEAATDEAAEEAATEDAAEDAATLDAAGEETATEDADAYTPEASTEDWPETTTKRIAARAASLALRRTAIPVGGPLKLWSGVLRVLGNCSGRAGSFMAQAGHVCSVPSCNVPAASRLAA